MKTIDELCQELSLDEKKSTLLKDYVNQLVVDLLKSLRKDNISNFDETIEALEKML